MKVIYIVVQKCISNTTNEIIVSINLVAFFNDALAYQYIEKARANEKENKFYRYIYKVEQVDIADSTGFWEK